MIHGLRSEAANEAGTTSALRQGPHQAVSYMASLALVATFFLLQALFAPTLGNQALYLYLVPPVLIAGTLGGLGPGLLATALSLGLHF